MSLDADDAGGWIGAVGAGATKLATDNFGCLVVDPRTGQVWSNQAATALFARPVSGLDGLGGSDLLGNAAFGLIETAVGVESGDHHWSTDVRVGVDRASKTVHVGRLESLQSDLGCVVVHIEDNDNKFVDPTPDIPPLQQLTFVNDHRNQVIAADRRLAYVGMDPSRQVGLSGFVTQHLSDQVKNLPLLRRLLAGDIGEANYSTRVIGPQGRWTSVRAYVRGLVGGDAAFVTSLTFDESSRPMIPVGVLAERETEVVRYLFVGLRIPQIALVQGVSSKTVRNQLSAVYTKLGVSGQVELLDSFHLPARIPRSGMSG